MRWILIILVLFLNGCTQVYDKGTYQEWYNKKEKEDAKKQLRKPQFIHREDSPFELLKKSVDGK